MFGELSLSIRIVGVLPQRRRDWRVVVPYGCGLGQGDCDVANNSEEIKIFDLRLQLARSVLGWGRCDNLGGPAEMPQG
jgi:hypothetical protein